MTCPCSPWLLWKRSWRLLVDSTSRQVSAGSPFHAGSCGEMEATTRAINTPREPNSLRSVAAMDPCKHHLQCFSASPITTSHST